MKYDISYRYLDDMEVHNRYDPRYQAKAKIEISSTTFGFSIRKITVNDYSWEKVFNRLIKTIKEVESEPKEHEYVTSNTSLEAICEQMLKEKEIEENYEEKEKNNI